MGNRLYRVEFKVVTYAVAPTWGLAVEEAREEMRHNADTAEVESVDLADVETARDDGWLDAYPWGGGGRRSVASILSDATNRDG